MSKTYQNGKAPIARFISKSFITAAAISACIRSLDRLVAAAAIAAAPLEAAACCKIFWILNFKKELTLGEGPPLTGPTGETDLRCSDEFSSVPEFSMSTSISLFSLFSCLLLLMMIESIVFKYCLKMVAVFMKIVLT